MSIQTKQGTVQERVSDKDVEQFLKTHPEFFEKHTQILAELKVPHITGGAVSLVERQVDVLRKQNRKLQKQLDDLVQIARDNEKLNRQVYKLTLGLMEAETLESMLEYLYQTLKSDFAADAVAIRAAVPKAQNRFQDRAEFVSDLERMKTMFTKLFEENRPTCGRFNQEQRKYLFGGAAERIGSMALLPLSAKSPFGMLAIGSHEETRFHAGMGTVYLNQMSHIVSKALLRFIEKR
jgi:uncharacterized protein YigA (DUF484 family)